MHAISKEKSLVVVLGMHRSGTSTVTCGLQSIGVDLGKKLIPSMQGVNDKGFFEDSDINAINIELLSSLGLSWHSLAPIYPDDLCDEKFSPLRLRAIELLEERLQDSDCFGLKDPRMCRLLPFWQEIFETLQLKVSYVVVVRNPLCVARSLERVHHLPSEKSHYLWLQHILPSLIETKGLPRVLVDYDQLMDDPKRQIVRIARLLGREHAMGEESLSYFCDDFLDNDLRHTNFNLKDVANDPLVPIPVKIATELLTKITKDRVSLESKKTVHEFNQLSEQMEGMAQILSYLLHLDNIIVDLNKTLEGKNSAVESLEQQLVKQGDLIDGLSLDATTRQEPSSISRAENHESVNQIGELRQQVSEKDHQIESLNKGHIELGQRATTLVEDIAERNRRIEAQNEEIESLEQRTGSLIQETGKQEKTIGDLALEVDKKEQLSVVLKGKITERNVRIMELSQQATERETQLDELNKDSKERADQIKELSQQATEREMQLAELNKDCKERAGQIKELSQQATERETQLDQLNKDSKERAVQIKDLSQQAAERETQLAALNKDNKERAGQIEELSQQATERETQLDELNKDSKERADLIEELSQQATERETQLAELKKDSKERADQIKELSQDISKRDIQLATLAQSNDELDHLVKDLSQKVAHREVQLDTLQQEVEQKESTAQHLASSSTQFSYRLDQIRTKPGLKLSRSFQKLIRQLPFVTDRLKVGLASFHQLHLDGTEWVSTGSDPQFLLVTDRAWRSLTGWYWLELTSVSEQPLNAELYFDVGEGFDRTRIIHFQLSGKGAQRIPFYVPFNCHAIRFDPCDLPATFTVSEVTLIKQMHSLKLPAEFLDQAVQFEALGGREGNIPGLKPANQITRHDDHDYCWRSENEDPWFLMQGFKSKLHAGWCQIDLRIRSNIDRGNAKIYFSYGGEFNEADSVHFPFTSGESTTFFDKLKEAPKHIRFDPLDCPANFSVEQLAIINVSDSMARQGLLQRLSTASITYRGQTPTRIWKDLNHLAATEQAEVEKLLVDSYSDTFQCSGVRDVINYASWIERNEFPDSTDVFAMELAQKSFNHRPVLSVIMPVYNAPEKFLRKAIESVIAQSYPEWQLCIADDASTASWIRPVLEEYAQMDSRIKVVFRSENGHISAASNSALELATGEYVALLDHDDELAISALHYMIEAINRNPSAKILYSDEDKIDAHGRREDPHFKSDWNPDLFFSQNYVSHLGVYHREMLQRIEGFRIGVEGCQDQDLVLRCLPYVASDEIVHIPRVLYHWRMLEGSTALNSVEKNYTTDAGIKALSDYFASQDCNEIQVEAGLVPNTYRVRYPITEPEPLVSLLIPTRDGLDFLEPCISSILNKTTYLNYEIIILDNESTNPEILEYFDCIQSENERVRVLSYPYSFNFAAVNNFGVEHAEGTLIGLINNDIEVINPEWLSEMVSHTLRPGIGCVGAKLYFADDTIQHAGIILGIGGVAGHSHKHFQQFNNGYFSRLKVVQNLSAVTAACLLVRKEVYEQVQGMETKLSVAFNDVDFCLKVMEAGYLNLWTPYASLYHYESKSRGKEDSPEKIERFRNEIEFMKSKWESALKRDRYYNVNLSLAHEDFSFGE